MKRAWFAVGLMSLSVGFSAAQGPSWSLSRDRRELTVGDEKYKIETGDRIVAAPGTRYYLAGNGTYVAGVFAVHIPESYTENAPLPLVVSSHGMNGSGVGDIRGWIGHANNHGFIAICPSFGSACLAVSYGEDRVMLREIMDRAFRSLKIDRRYVLGTGHSGGGLVVWDTMMSYPNWFTALSFRGANFKGNMASPTPFRDRPVFVVWGEMDHPMIFTKPWNGEGPTGFEIWLRLKGSAGAFRNRRDPNVFEDTANKLKWAQVPGAGHWGFNNLVAEWFSESVIKASRNVGPVRRPAAAVPAEQEEEWHHDDEEDEPPKPAPPAPPVRPYIGWP